MITQLIILVFVMLAAVLLGLAEIFFLPGLTSVSYTHLTLPTN